MMPSCASAFPREAVLCLLLKMYAVAKMIETAAMVMYSSLHSATGNWQFAAEYEAWV